MGNTKTHLYPDEFSKLKFQKSLKPPTKFRHWSAVFYKNSIYCYGGKPHHKHVFKYDLSNQRWSIFKTMYAPSPRYAHSAVVYKNNMIVFGGCSNAWQFGYTNEVIELDLEKGEWRWLVPEGFIVPRIAHTAVIIDSYMLVFGGKSMGGLCSNHIWQLSLQDESWTNLTTFGNAPSPRYLHSACVYERKMIIYGGKDLHFVFDDLYIFDYYNRVWYSIEMVGSLPGPRCSHFLFPYKNYLILIGGTNKHSINNNYSELNLDVYKLCFKKGLWKKKSKAFPGRIYFAATTDPNYEHAYIFGGCNFLWNKSSWPILYRPHEEGIQFCENFYDVIIKHFVH